MIDLAGTNGWVEICLLDARCFACMYIPGPATAHCFIRTSLRDRINSAALVMGRQLIIALARSLPTRRYYARTARECPLVARAGQWL